MKNSGKKIISNMVKYVKSLSYWRLLWEEKKKELKNNQKKIQLRNVTR